jgi:hypothetical protein
MTDHMQIEDTPEFANYENSLDDRGASPPEPSIWSWGGRGGFAGGLPATGWGPDRVLPAAPASFAPENDSDYEAALEAAANQSRSVDVDRADEILSSARVPSDSEFDDLDGSKIPLLSEAQWAHVCAELGIDPSFQF